MIKLQHWVVIRYNLGMYACNQKHPGYADKWMADRYELFSKYTAKSLAYQTCKDFKVLVLLDSETPDQDHLNINLALDDVDHETVLIPWPKEEKTYAERTSITIDHSLYLNGISRFSKNSVQTRIDNDDALMPNAIELIQRRLRKTSDKYVVDFKRGYILDVENQRAYEAYHYQGSPFISLVQRNSTKMKSIYDNIHRNMAKRVDIEFNENDRAWVMVIHGANRSNTIPNNKWMIESETDYNLIAGLFEDT